MSTLATGYRLPNSFKFARRRPRVPPEKQADAARATTAPAPVAGVTDRERGLRREHFARVGRFRRRRRSAAAAGFGARAASGFGGQTRARDAAVDAEALLSALSLLSPLSRFFFGPRRATCLAALASDAVWSARSRSATKSSLSRASLSARALRLGAITSSALDDELACDLVLLGDPALLEVALDAPAGGPLACLRERVELRRSPRAGASRVRARSATCPRWRERARRRRSPLRSTPRARVVPSTSSFGPSPAALRSSTPTRASLARS